MIEIKVFETSVKLIKGDITEETTDAVVNLMNTKCNRSSGVSKAIFDAAGGNIKEEYERLAKLPNNGYVVTSAGNMKCKKIIHLIAEKPHNFVVLVMNALKVCDRNNIATVSLPAMGTGEAKETADLLEGIVDYLSTHGKNISEIIIVVFVQDVYKKYQRFFQNYKTNYPYFSAFGKVIELVKGDITYQVVDCVVNLANSSLNQSSGVSGAILKAAGDTVKEECKKIGALQRDGVAITSGGKPSGGELGSKHIMHIIGPTEVSAYQPSIDRILQECHKNGFTSVALPAIGTGIAGVAVEKSITAILNSILNYLSDTSIPSLETIFIIVIDENIYKKYLEVFQAKSTELQALQREEKILSAIVKKVPIEYPITWTDIEKSEYQEVILKETSPEYKEVKEKFFKTISETEYKITQIKRIQNEKVFKCFAINKHSVNEKNPGQKNIRHLYHGTSVDVINNINHNGFNRSYSGMNGTSYGNGTYFAEDSKYSCGDTYSCPDANGLKYIYQAAVITGRYCKGVKEYKDAPYVDGDPKKGRYDSVVDDVANPKMFVVFYDDAAYPEYLITFKKP
ncbi:protein mono-ADP-ribosyltransferase PARP15-like isoform 1-T2 [Anomaloglossus baeobatrachus]|uniref:protein mono-ADP-ribosyltransferase PARP15-like n=1 Tax=Anomaloglossus baeobatrachus TaxID=238106 RepID=UPI003F4F8DEC